MKIVGDPIPADSLAYYMSTMAEEGMEMLGVVLFLYAQLRYMTGEGQKSVEVSVELA